MKATGVLQQPPPSDKAEVPSFQPPVTDPIFESSFVRTLRNIFGLDLRSLALFRIGVALVVLWDLQDRAQDLRAHYTGEGVLPLVPPPGIAPLPLSVLPFSFHNLCDDFYYQAGLFLLHASAAIALLVGYRTRLMTLLVWALLLSVQARTNMLIHAGDVLMRMVLFWGIFLPLGAIWSVDAARARRLRPPSSVVVSPATVAFILQMCFVYTFAVLWKTDPAWRGHFPESWTIGPGDFTAVGDALRIDTFTTPLGIMSRQYPQLMKAFTMITMFIEGCGPILILFPFASQRVRLIGVLLFMGLHIGIGLNMELGNFAPICVASWTAVLPPWFWDRLRFWRVTRWPTAVRDSVPPRPSSTIETALVCFFLAYVLFLNVGTLNQVRRPDGSKVYPEIPDSNEPLFNDRTMHLGQTLGLQQGWGVFAPAPGKYFGWILVRARLQDGSLVDLHRNGAPLTLDKPALVSASYINSRWRRYLNNLDMDKNVGHRQLFVSYLEREWQKHHPDRKIVKIALIFMKQNPRPDGGEDITPYLMALTVTPEGVPPPEQLTPKQVAE